MYATVNRPGFRHRYLLGRFIIFWLAAENNQHRMPTWALRAGRQSPPSLQQSVNHQTHTQQILFTIVRALATRLKRQPVWLLVLVGWLLFRLPQRRLVASLLFQEPPRKTKAVFGQLSQSQIDKTKSKMQCSCRFF